MFDIEWSMLADIKVILEVRGGSKVFGPSLIKQWIPHRVQQVISSNANPILSGSILAFTIFMTTWEELDKHRPKLKPWIDVGLEWVTTYYAWMDLTKAYIMTMGK